jgi:hypothetical protein
MTRVELFDGMRRHHYRKSFEEREERAAWHRRQALEIEERHAEEIEPYLALALHVRKHGRKAK